MASKSASDPEIDVAVWLERLGLDEFAAAFAQNKIDAVALKLLSEDDLKELGVVALGDRRKLSAAISELSQEHVSSPHGRTELPPDPQTGSPLSYTPYHLATRILHERGDLKGERKHVTVLFADIKDSTSLIEHADPEEAAQKLGPAISHMMTAVHQYEGTVNKVQGDGIMALFGAPLAHEDHAQRACMAAQAMLESIADTGDSAVELRIGLHSGDVLVRTIHNDLSMDYDAIGATVHLASRIEQLARPGSVFMTAATQALIEGFFETQSLGAKPVKGMSRDVQVFELIRRTRLVTRWEARSARELTNFVGRRVELESLLRSADRALSGQGELIALVGEAGMGKSRLLHELLRAPQITDWLVVQTGTSPFGISAAFMPLGILLRSLFGVSEGDTKSEINNKIQEGLRRYDVSTGALPSAVRFLLNSQIDDPAWIALDPQQRRNVIIEELRRFLLQIAHKQPLLLIFEDLHWIDSETQRLLDALAGSLGAHRLLLIVTYRPEYHHDWAVKSYYTRIRVDPLGDATAHAMLDALLGSSAKLEVLKGVLIERTQGRPLFVEELVRSLKDAGIISESEDSIDLIGNVDQIEIPGSVQDVIASRIDRLEPELKSLLQIASVIGRRVPVALIKLVTDSPASAIERQLAKLQEMEFLYEAGDGTNPEFLFKHALTEEVTYVSLVHEMRRTLHGRLVDAIEIEYADRLEENCEVIARHALAAERWAQAYDYSRKAARKAHARSAYQAAIEWFDQAVAALDRLPEAEDQLADKMDVRLEMRIALWPLGQHELLARRVREAGVLAERAGDTLRLAIVHNYLTAHHWQAGEHKKAIKTGEKGIALAEQADDFSVLATTKQHLGLALLARGDYARQTKLHREVVQSLVGKQMLQRHGMAGYPAALSRGFLAYGLAELGEFYEAFRWAHEGVEIAHQVNSAMTTVWVTNNLALTHLMQGEPEKSLELMQPNFELCCKSEVKLLFSQTAGILGRTLTIVSRPLEGIKVLEQATHPDNLEHHTEGMGYPIVWLALAMLASDRLADGLGHAHRALKIATTQGERGHQAWALFARAEMEAALAHYPEQQPKTYNLALQIAEECEMHPLATLCRSRLSAG